LRFKAYYFCPEIDGTAIVFLIEIKDMKTREIIAGLVALAAALTTYYIINRRQVRKTKRIHRTHHLAEIYSQKPNQP